MWGKWLKNVVKKEKRGEKLWEDSKKGHINKERHINKEKELEPKESYIEDGH